MTSTSRNHAETVELPRQELQTNRSSGSHPHAELVAGSRPDLSREVLDLLRERLRLSALLLSTGFLAFLLVSFFTNDWQSLWNERVVFGLHVMATAVNAFIAWRLCSNCEKINHHLRLAEALVFGSSAIFFVSISYFQTVDFASNGSVPNILAPWLILILTYSLFVPNTWQRAAVVIGLMAAAPVVVQLIARFTSPDFLRLINENPDYQLTTLYSFMAMALAATIAVGGVKSIRSLRQEAFEAKRLGQYQLKRLIGEGGMGEVYIAEHLLLKRPCAIKIIKAESAGDPHALARFEREVKATARLTHWNTVDIYDYGHTDDGTFYYVMEYLPGMNVDDLINAHGPMPPARVVHLLTQTCDALAEAHAADMIHRDLKPANIFAAKRGRVYDVAKLLDFGLVRQSQTDDDLTLTAQHSILGSPHYMSPEQAAGEQVDARSDIYSLGVSAYVMLTGRPPFEADRAIQVILAHAKKPPTPPSDLVAEVPADLEQVVMRCLAKDPDDRYASVDELREALNACQCAGGWTSADAAAWWECHGCPKKKELDAAVLGSSASIPPQPPVAAAG